MARLENEFRDSLLMPLPNMSNNGGNMYERDHRHEQIPGGYEIYDREVKSSSGRRINKDGNPTEYKWVAFNFRFKLRVFFGINSIQNYLKIILQFIYS